MPRSIVSGLGLLLLAAGLLVPAHAARAGAWSTWIKMSTVSDMIALKDTVYVATGEAGILRYLRPSGRFESITREPGGLAANHVTSMTFDRSGRLWAGTAGKGASRLSASGSSWDLVNTFDGLPSDSVTVLRADGDTVWVGTTRGIALWNGQTIAGSVPDIGTPSPFRSNVVSGIVVQGDLLWVATLDGIFQARLSEDLRNWTEVDNGIADRAIVSLAANGQKLFALSNGFTYAWNASNSTWGTEPANGNAYKVRDDFGTLLMTTQNGLYRWGGSQWDLVPGSLGSGSGADFTEFATDPAGNPVEMQVPSLYELSGGTWVEHPLSEPVDNDVQNVLFDGRRLWAGTHTRGMSRFDGTSWRNFPTGCCGPAQDTTFLDPQECMTLQLDAAGRLWTSHWGSAIERIDASTNPMHVDHVIRATSSTLAQHTNGWSSAMDSTGYLYIGGDSPSRSVIPPVGIDVYDPAGNLIITWKTTNARLGDNQVRAIAVDKSRTIWAGFANNGVSWASLDSVDSDALVPGNDHMRFPQFTPVASLSTTDIMAVHAHGDSIWVLTTGDLQRIPRSGRTVSAHYDIPAGPAPRGAVHPLDVSPDGTVWVGSQEGIRRYVPGGGSVDYRIDNSPLADNEVRSLYVEPATGAVWIGTAGGLNRFDPNYHAPAPPSIARLSLRLWPNPAKLTAMGTQVRVDANTPNLTGEVIDLVGRVQHRFSGVAAGGLVWDGRDTNGALVRPGVYFVHASGGGREAMIRVVVLR